MPVSTVIGISYHQRDVFSSPLLRGSPAIAHIAIAYEEVRPDGNCVVGIPTGLDEPPTGLVNVQCLAEMLGHRTPYASKPHRGGGSPAKPALRQKLSTVGDQREIGRLFLDSSDDVRPRLPALE